MFRSLTSRGYDGSKLSTAVTCHPSSRRTSTRWLPTNPAAPVTSACRIGRSAVLLRAGDLLVVGAVLAAVVVRVVVGVPLQLDPVQHRANEAGPALRQVLD